MKRVILFLSTATTVALVTSFSVSRGLAYRAQGATGAARIIVKVMLSGTAPAHEGPDVGGSVLCQVASD